MKKGEAGASGGMQGMMMGTRYQYGVAVVFYYPDKACIERVANYRAFRKVYIIDNTPEPHWGYVSVLQGQSQVEYYPMGRNTGISGALNFIFPLAARDGLDYLLTMDQDTDFGQAQIGRMVAFIEQKQGQCRAAAAYSANYRKAYVGKGGSGQPGRWRIPKSRVARCRAVMTSGSFYSVKAVLGILPLPDLRVGFVDHSMSYALREKGYALYMVGQAGLSQRVGMAVMGTALNRLLHKVALSPQRYYYMGRNSAYLLHKYRSSGGIAAEVAAARLRVLFNLIVCEAGKREKIRMWRKGTLEYREAGKRAPGIRV